MEDAARALALAHAQAQAQAQAGAEGGQDALLWAAAEEAKLRLLALAQQAHSAAAHDAAHALRNALLLAQAPRHAGPRLDLALHLAGLHAMEGREGAAEELLAEALARDGDAGGHWALLLRVHEARISLLSGLGRHLEALNACEAALGAVCLAPLEQQQHSRQAVLLTALHAAEALDTTAPAEELASRLLDACHTPEQQCSAHLAASAALFSLGQRRQAEGLFDGDLGLSHARQAAALARTPEVAHATALAALVHLAKVLALLPARHAELPALLLECRGMAACDEERALVAEASAACAEEQGLRSEALLLYEEALALAHCPRARAPLLAALSRISAALHDHDRFERHFWQLGREAHEAGTGPDKAWEVASFMAQWYLERDRPDRALEAAQEAAARVEEAQADGASSLATCRGAGPWPGLLHHALRACRGLRLPVARQREVGQRLVLAARRARTLLPDAEAACLSVLSQFERDADLQ